MKTTVYLPEEDYERLKARGRREGRSAAELIREAVRQYARERGYRKRPKSIGSAKSGQGDVSERVDELLEGMGRS